jgi:hypothetical protein
LENTVVVAEFERVVAGDLGKEVLDIPIERATVTDGAAADGAEAEVDLNELVVGVSGGKAELGAPVRAGVDGAEDEGLAHQADTEVVDKCGRERIGVGDHGVAVGLVVFAVLADERIGVDVVGAGSVGGVGVAEEEGMEVGEAVVDARVFLTPVDAAEG